MIALFDHPADVREAVKAARFAPAKRELLEVWYDGFEELADRPAFELESAIRLRFPDPATSEVRLQSLEKRQILLVQREREGRTNLDAATQLGPEAERDAEASLTFRQAGHEPWLQCCTYSIGTHSLMRAGVLHDVLQSGTRPGRHASPFGSVVTGSLG